MSRLDLQPDHMQRDTAPAHGDFNAIDEADARTLRGLGSFGEPADVIVVGERQDVNALLGRSLHKLGRRENAVGYAGMAMQIVVQHGQATTGLGTGGIPDVTTVSNDVYLYVPRHSRVTFVEKLDFLSGLGYHAAGKSGQGPRLLVTDLGLFDYAHERMRLVSYHPNSSIEQIRAKTGFQLDVSPNVQVTPPPSGDELRLLREEIDPLGIRNLESLGGSARRELLQRIIAIENSQESTG